MPIYTIIAGVNGVGKSSLTGVLKAERNDLGYIINADKIALDENCSDMKAARIAITKIRDCLSKNVSFTQETTMSGTQVGKTVMAAKQKGYSIRLFYIGLNTLNESIIRIKNRVEKGGHNILDADVERRFNKRFVDLMKILPHCNEVHFYDNNNGFVYLGEYKNGELFLKGDYKPNWIIVFRQLLIS